MKNNKTGDSTGKKDLNAGSAAFNMGSEQDPDYNKGTKVSDEEKRTGHTPSPGKQKVNKKDHPAAKNSKSKSK